MKKFSVMLLLLNFALWSSNNFAVVKIVECEDENGNRSFQKTCPPGTTLVGEKKLRTGSPGSGTENSNVDIQATIYLVPDCDACDEVKEFLNGRDISITEKNVKDNIELQDELNKLVGALKVPTTVIGDEILSGYSRQTFMEALKAAGYKEDS